MTNWFKNARPISLPQSMLPALTAVALSYGQGEFSWIAAIASVIGVMFLHLGLNLLDDWFDYRVGSAEARQKVAKKYRPLLALHEAYSKRGGRAFWRIFALFV